MLETLPLNEAVYWVSSLKAQSIVAALENMTPKKAAVLLRRLPSKQAAHIVLGLNAARAGELILALPPHYKKKLADNLEPSLLNSLENILAAPKGSVARAMGGNYFTFKTDAKIKDITAKIKSLPKNRIPAAVYIIDKSGRLAGTVKTAELAFYGPDAAAGSIMSAAFDKLAPLDDARQALKIFKSSGAAVLPVVDGDGFLLGTVNFAHFTGEAPRIAMPKDMRRKILAAFTIGFLSALCFYLLLVWIFV